MRSRSKALRTAVSYPAITQDWLRGRVVFGHYVIMGEPVTKKNRMEMAINQTTGKWFPVQNKQARLYAAHAHTQLRLQRGVRLCVRDRDIGVIYWLFPSSRRKDDGNISAMVDDCVAKAGIIANDRQIVERHVRLQVDAVQPRVECTFFLMEAP